MRRPQGYATIVDPDKPTVERDTFTCAHCNCIVTVEPRQDPATMGGVCRMCSSSSPAYICAACVDLGTCVPFERRLEAEESRGRLLRAAGI
ncbi:MAG TPA: hypothetical protein VIU64_18635 [Polyangia bacterium]